MPPSEPFQGVAAIDAPALIVSELYCGTRTICVEVVDEVVYVWESALHEAAIVIVLPETEPTVTKS